MLKIGKWNIKLAPLGDNEMTAFRSEEDDTLLIVDQDHDKVATLLIEDDDSLIVSHLAYDKTITVNHKTHTATIACNPTFLEDEFGEDDDE